MTLTAERLRHVLDYEPETGQLTWRISPKYNIAIGAVAGCINGSGYRIVMIDGRLYLAHRLAWLHVHGAWPTGQIDHVNEQKADNRIANLRDCGPTQHLNMANRSQPERGSKTGLRGVTFDRRSGKWSARVVVRGKRHWLGEHDTPEAASAAYAAAKARLFVEAA